MRTVYQHPLCPFSRKVRLTLHEKKLDFSMENHSFWDKTPEFLELNPAGQVPVFVDLNGTVICDSQAICEYLDEAYPEKSLIGETIVVKAEVRRLVAWFDLKAAGEFTLPLLFEKVVKRNLKIPGNTGPCSQRIRQAKTMLLKHLEYIAWLCDRRNWLAGDNFSLADIAAASHISVIDYMGDIPWSQHELVKNWYVRVKSRPSFRTLLQDKIPGLSPYEHYSQLDF